MKRVALIAALAALAGCGGQDASQPGAKQRKGGEAEPATTLTAQTVTQLAPGTTPMAQRVAVLGIMNKRNGLSREVTMKPGQAISWGDVIVRLRACETTAPWEIQQLTGAFVQVDVRNPRGQFQRNFSGWVYKESPALNVVEHPVYDVWPKSCAMTHPEAAGSQVREGSAASSRSSAPNSTRSSGRPKASPVAPASTPPAVSAAESNSI